MLIISDILDDALSAAAEIFLKDVERKLSPPADSNIQAAPTRPRQAPPVVMPRHPNVQNPQPPHQLSALPPPPTNGPQAPLPQPPQPPIAPPPPNSQLHLDRLPQDLDELVASELFKSYIQQWNMKR